MTRFLLMLLLLAPAWAFSQQEGRGRPFVKNYLPKDYSGHAQNWSIVQDSRGVLFVGNGNGVLSYDGGQWRVADLPDKSTARSMAFGPDSVLYVGTSTEFGYIETAKNGKLKFIDLTMHLPDSLRKSLTDIWETFATGKAVYFRSYYVLIEYAPATKALRYWETPQNNRFNTMFVLRDKIFIHVAGKGVYNPAPADTLVLAPDGFRFIEEKLPLGVTFPYNDDTIILSGRAGGLYKYPFSPNKVADDAYFAEANNVLKTDRVYTSAVHLPNGGYAIGSLGSGLLVFNSQFKLTHTISKETDNLKNETIYCVANDRDGAVWLGGANGVGRVDLAADISFWSQESGIVGTVYWAQRFKGVLYAATSSSLFYLNERGQAIQVAGVDNVQCWHLLPFTNPNNPEDKRLLVSSSREIREVQGSQTIVVADAGVAAAFKMQYDPNDPYRIWIAYGDGFGSIRFNGHKDPKKAWTTEPRIAGAEDNNRSIQVAENGDIWIGTFRKGVIRLIKKPGERNYEVRRYTALSNGLLSDKNVIVFKAAGHVIFGTDKGLCTYNAQTDRFEPFCKFGEEFCNGSKDIFSLQEDARGNVWLGGLFTHTSGMVLASKQPDGSYIIDANPFKKLPPMMCLALAAEPNGRVWAGGAEGLFLYEGAGRDVANIRFNALIRQVRLENDSIVFHGNHEAKEGNFGKLGLAQFHVPTLDASNNSLIFEYAAPFFDNEDQTQFRFYLEGHEQGWSAWEKRREKEYSNLPGGTYTFRVQAKNLYGQLSEEASYTFHVLTPWYWQWYAWACYLLALGALFWAGIRFNTRRLQRDKEKLERIVSDRTAEVVQQKEELAQQAENLQALNYSISEKNEELARQHEEIYSQKQAVEQAYENLKRLSEIGQDITHNLSVEHIIDTVYENVNALMDASGLGIGIYNEALNRIEFPGFIEKGEKLPFHWDDLGDDDSLSDYCFKHKAELLLSDVQAEISQYVRQSNIIAAQPGEIPESLIYLPLLVKGKCIGNMTVQSFKKHAYTDYHLSMMRNIAIYTAIALENADIYHKIEMQKALVELEQERSERLLLNILPKDVAEELKADGAVQPKFYEQSTVMFTDFQGFSAYAHKYSPQIVLKKLDECFMAFDRIVDRHGVEKIKTIGDAYMCAAGLPAPSKDSAERMVRVALEMQAFMRAWNEENAQKGDLQWELRVGIHTGDVIAGVIGTKKFAYDIWGDTVNTANRIEASDVAGKISISAHTYQLVRHLFDCEYRGKVEMKGIGGMDLYFVEGPLTANELPAEDATVALPIVATEAMRACILQLSKTPIYKTAEALAAIQPLLGSDDASIAAWAQQIQEAVIAYDEEAYHHLLQTADGI